MQKTTYKVIEAFTDLQDNNYLYKVGEPFPREGVTVSDERIAELMGSKNKRKTPLIKAVEETTEPPKKAGSKKQAASKE